MASALRGSRLTALTAILALLAVVATSTLSLLHGVGEDDACGPGAAQHDPAAHRIQADAAATGSPHCVICHLWQSVGRFRGPNLPSTLIPIIDFGLVAKPPVVAPELAVAASRPARAPPLA